MRLWGVRQAIEHKHEAWEPEPEHKWEPTGCIGLLVTIVATATVMAWFIAALR